MRTFASAVLVLGAIAIAGCGRTPLQPDQAMTAQAGPDVTQAPLPSPTGTRTVTTKPEIDPTYANGTTVYMIGPHLIVNARETMPQAYAHAEELYLVVYPQASIPQPGAGPITLPFGYQPQCNPCFHPGLPPAFVYHDHVISGAPGMGNNGTAGQFKAPWKIIVLVYNPDVAYSKTVPFTPVKSQTELDNAEKNGVFLEINPNGDNKFEIDTGNLLICPIVSDHA